MTRRLPAQQTLTIGLYQVLRMPSVSNHSRRQNLIAGIIAFSGIGLLYAGYDPETVGENPTSESDQVAAAVAVFEVPLPPEAAEMVTKAAVVPKAGSEQQPAENEASDTEVSFNATLSNQELIEYSLLLLRDGAEFLKTIDTYTATFHKQERLGGDLTDTQMIDVKIRQGENFAVYMKWRNGDRGRQLLYSKEYEDGDMVVKLGGFKGRLLPGIKLNPHGSRASEESRHPVTQAGLLGMAEKMILHREQDLARGHGMTCQRLPNQVFDDRDCYCFVYLYDSPQVREDYRKTILLVDAQKHIPVMARNYTWAAEADDLSSEELDQLTLVENYAFTKIDFGTTLTAEHFSRENPRYRM
jgi:hypothetical protein